MVRWIVPASTPSRGETKGLTKSSFELEGEPSVVEGVLRSADVVWERVRWFDGPHGDHDDSRCAPRSEEGAGEVALVVHEWTRQADDLPRAHRGSDTKAGPMRGFFRA